MKKIEIQNYRFNFEREPLIRPFQIKGASFTEKWTLVTSLESNRGMRSTGIGGTAVLWSDPSVFFSYSEAGGNMVMAAMAERAARSARGKSFSTPLEIMEILIPEIHEYGKTITGNPKLTKTFTLNSLVSLDLALWNLYALENGIGTFDELIPREYRPALSHRQERIAHVPTVSYNYPIKDLLALVDSGHFILKIKLGQAGSPAEMARKDSERLSEIHRALEGRGSLFTGNGKLVYYLDANGRYPDKTRLYQLVDHAEKIHMLEQVALLEEPFPEEVKVDISDIPVRIAADESLHDMESVAERIDMGYKALTLKPAGKTFSMSLYMAKAAFQRGIPCFVADNACVPLLVEWNKNFEARLPPFPGLSMGILESNGEQNYKNWRNLIDDHPLGGAGWIEPRRGAYHLDEHFYQTAGGIFLRPGHYQNLVEGTDSE
ncbi:MAG: L-alanine-DL-glutamate epimerase [Deltaproteobacteria bacterium]|nr:L-alanine-DL-glutamate epimerase [Deltaproteobacteria bacterium]